MSSAIKQKHQILARALESPPESAEAPCNKDDFLTPQEINLLSCVPGALLLFAANGMQVWSNETAKTLLGANTELLEQVNPQHAVEALQFISGAARDGVSNSITIKVQQVDDTGVTLTKTLSLNGSCFKPHDPILPEAFALVSIVDVTSENELAIKLENACQENEDKNHFFSSMSHELRTPLNAIIGFAELLEGKAAIQIDDVKRLEYASLISGSANHLLGLINDILDLSRLDAGRNEPCKEPIDLTGSLNTVAHSMIPIAMRKRVDVIVEESDHVPNIHTDPRALTQILTNIISNAIKFSHENGVVRVKTMRLRNRVKIIISDNGIGMDTETLSKLGGLFYQSGDVIRGNYGGSGLGLSIVYKLVDLIGGKIAINSQHGVGTSVTIILPTGSGSARPVPASTNDDVVYLTGMGEKLELPLPTKTTNSGVK